jgi:hypothetical protein
MLLLPFSVKSVAHTHCLLKDGLGKPEQVHQSPAHVTCGDARARGRSSISVSIPGPGAPAQTRGTGSKCGNGRRLVCVAWRPGCGATLGTMACEQLARSLAIVNTQQARISFRRQCNHSSPVHRPTQQHWLRRPDAAIALLALLESPNVPFRSRLTAQESAGTPPPDRAQLVVVEAAATHVLLMDRQRDLARKTLAIISFASHRGGLWRPDGDGCLAARKVRASENSEWACFSTGSQG